MYVYTLRVPQMLTVHLFLFGRDLKNFIGDRSSNIAHKETVLRCSRGLKSLKNVRQQFGDTEESIGGMHKRPDDTRLDIRQAILSLDENLFVDQKRNSHPIPLNSTLFGELKPRDHKTFVKYVEEMTHVEVVDSFPSTLNSWTGHMFSHRLWLLHNITALFGKIINFKWKSVIGCVINWSITSVKVIVRHASLRGILCARPFLARPVTSVPENGRARLGRQRQTSYTEDWGNGRNTKRSLRRKESLPEVYNRARYFVTYGAYGIRPKSEKYRRLAVLKCFPGERKK